MKPSMMMNAGKGGAMERTTQPVAIVAAAVRSETWSPKWCRKKLAEMDERKYPAVLARKTIEISSYETR
jgi:hypothetical protein